MPIKDFLNNYPYEPTNFNFEDFKRQALEEFTSDEGSWNAKVTQVTEQAKAQADANNALKAKNWDLLQQIPSTQPKEVSGQNDGAEDSGSTPTIDSFFGKE